MNNTFTSGFSKSAIQPNWEAQLMNDREYYAKSPVAKFAISRGDISAEKFLSRTFNRRLRMADTFTKVLPTYEHVPKTCY